ncbi:MAG TPA: hypothetical protein DCM07_28355 [Planctomycetaceae bacterium]|nr:hypothetical protein [Gimesia sp.]HAH48682.1 hypothetical protein [Planctomycetaceae bacterium]HBL42919.1 hypothetical protein [Planctomycetaceae bacterium]|tara:strand:+ start:17710 stop:18249 length:540 start_codon:yes stop_codon:yes gene_type:complete
MARALRLFNLLNSSLFSSFDIPQEEQAESENNGMASKRDRMSVYEREGVTVLDFGTMEIWDGADLALLRETLTRLVDQEGCKSIGVELSSVKYIPSGFFGMLYDLYEKGIAVTLYSPQPNVASMLWFKQFCIHTEDGRYLLKSDTAAAQQSPTEEQVRSEKEKWEKSLKQSSDYSTTVS